jgi:hypothetical protein
MPSCPKLYLKTFPESPEVDQIYQVLKQATEISNSKPRVNVEPATPGITVDRSANSNPGSSGSSGQSLNRRPGPPIQPSRAAGPNLAVINPAPCSTSSGLSRLEVLLRSRRRLSRLIMHAFSPFFHIPHGALPTSSRSGGSLFRTLKQINF